MFNDILFPPEISYGSKGGPKFSTSIITLASGKERRNRNWIDVRAEYDVAHGIKDRDQMIALRDFFYARYGRANSFRFKDWSDFEVIDQIIGIGDGSATIFQIIKTYTSGSQTYIRNITKPVVNSITSITIDDVPKIEDTDYTVDYTTGLVTFAIAPLLDEVVKVVTAEFDVHVRFDTDHFDPVHEFWQTESWPTIPIVEIKDSI